MGKWVKDRLDSFCHIEMGQSPDSSGYNSEGVGLPLIQGNADIKNRKTIKRNFTSIITKTSLPGEIILTVRAPVGNVAVATDECCLGRGVCAISSSNVDKHFLYHALIWRESEWQKLEQGSTFTAVGHKEVESFSIEYPILENEQRHIAEILTTCDEVIEKSEAVAEKYRAIKAGMLKDLFTRGIGKNGKLRPPPESSPQLYKDTVLGKVPREWEVKRLGSVCFPPQYGLNVAAVKYDGKHGYLRITDIDDESHSFIRQGITSPSMYEEIYRAQEGDVFFARTGASTGKTYLYRAEDGELYFAGFLIKFHCKERVNSAYVFYQTLTTRYMNWVSAVSTRTGQPGINSQELSTFRMAIPSDPAEQRQIAERLSAIDAKIADELAVIAKYRKVKAGLMARLLTPPPDAEIVDGGG